MECDAILHMMSSEIVGSTLRRRIAVATLAIAGLAAVTACSPSNSGPVPSFTVNPGAGSGAVTADRSTTMSSPSSRPASGSQAPPGPGTTAFTAPYTTTAELYPTTTAQEGDGNGYPTTIPRTIVIPPGVNLPPGVPPTVTLPPGFPTEIPR